MQGGPGIPTFYWYGEEAGYNILVIELLGVDLYDILESCKELSITTITSIANQMLLSIKHFHNNNYVHRDIKPTNFVLSREGSRVYMIDYGLSKRYRNGNNFTHISYRDHKDIVGTVRYSSLNTHRGIEQSRRDDMESLGYTLIYLAKGALPWQKPEGKTRLQKYTEVQKKKETLPLEELCEGLDLEFIKYMSYCRTLKFEQCPDYSYLQRLFKSCFYRQEDNKNFKYDWIRLGVSTKVVTDNERLEDVTNQALGANQRSDYSISQSSVDLCNDGSKKAYTMKMLTNKKKEERQRSVGHHYTRVRDFSNAKAALGKFKQKESSLGYVSRLFNIKHRYMFSNCEEEKLAHGDTEAVYNHNKGETIAVSKYPVKQQRERIKSVNQNSTTKSDISPIETDMARMKYAAYLQTEKNSDYIDFRKTKKPINAPDDNLCDFQLEEILENPPGTKTLNKVECDIPNEKPVNFNITMPVSAARVSLKDHRPKKRRRYKETFLHLYGAKTDSLFKDVKLESTQGDSCKSEAIIDKKD
jgi:serine/threonine protein kinase